MPLAAEPPIDRDQFSRDMARRMLTMAGMARRCREPLCRRRRTCAGRTMRCQRDFPPPPMSQEEEAHLMARLQRDIKRRLEQMASAGGKP